LFTRCAEAVAVNPIAQAPELFAIRCAPAAAHVKSIVQTPELFAIRCALAAATTKSIVQAPLEFSTNCAELEMLSAMSQEPELLFTRCDVPAIEKSIAQLPEALFTSCGVAVAVKAIAQDPDESRYVTPLGILFALPSRPQNSPAFESLIASPRLVQKSPISAHDHLRVDVKSFAGHTDE
jgi:hypothetical protein